MYKKHKYFILPSPTEENTVWRYMDFWKFKDLISSSELYMSTIKNMGDKYEGRIPDKVRKKWVDNLQERGLKSSAEFVEQMGSFEPILNYNISSWNINKNESYALWKIYTQDHSAVAIRTNITKLITSFKNNDYWQHIGKINYFDHPSNFKFDSNIMNVALNKFDYYSFENELRILNIVPANVKIKDASTNESGNIRVNMNLDELIEAIYLAPNATEDDFNNVKKLLYENNLSKDIYISGINDKWSNQ